MPQLKQYCSWMFKREDWGVTHLHKLIEKEYENHTIQMPVMTCPWKWPADYIFLYGDSLTVDPFFGKTYILSFSSNIKTVLVCLFFLCFCLKLSLAACLFFPMLFYVLFSTVIL